MSPARGILLIVLIAFFALLGVAQRVRIVHLGLRTSRLDSERDRLAEANRNLRCEISALSDPARIADEVERLDIALLNPVELSRVPESDAHRTAQSAPARRAGSPRRR